MRDLIKHFTVGRGFVSSLTGNQTTIKAVNGVSLTVNHGESVGLVGESGCGKTTTGKLLVKLLEPTSGAISFGGQNLSSLDGAQLKTFRRRAQIMFQNPYESFSPRFTIFRAVAEPLLIHGVGDRPERTERVAKALHDVHLRPPSTFFQKYPHELSGGQLQRVAFARALVLEPEFLVADEPVSMLDVSVRAGILNTMREQSRRNRLTTVYISHDLSLIQYLCDRTAIMYLGQIVESGPTVEVIARPRHPYTRALISAIPIPEPARQRTPVPIHGGIPTSSTLPAGCPFHPRCPYVMDVCRQHVPPPIDVGEGHFARCFLHGGIEVEGT
jgi:oligopeptide/dipeptide ABC transporter ATP-binding protein